MFRRTLLLTLTLSLALLATGCFSNNNVSLWPEIDDELTTMMVRKPLDDSENRVLLLDIEGVISEYGNSSLFYDLEATTTLVRKKLEKAQRDERIKAVVLRVNSPGGTVTASDIVYHEILKYKKTAKVPVVAAIMGVGASGGYYVSCSADKIMSHPTAINGSIGVIMHSFGFAGLFEKIGMESRVVKSGKLKDMGNPFNEMTDDERAVLQKIVDTSYERFLEVVAAARPQMTKEQIRAAADGRIMTAAEAQELGLIDKLGDLEDAIDEAMTMANICDAGVILYTTSKKPDQNIFSATSAQAPEINLNPMGVDFETLVDLSRPRMYYMWMGY
ncbi:MAG TPA: signal peptide peptidase SppA [bacterium]|nr:signal peptide peptidase SppA [bacterium]